MCGKLAANARLNFAVICAEKLAAKCANSLRQRHGKGRGKNSIGCGKFTAKICGKLKCRLPRLCRKFAVSFAELLQIIFRGKSRGKLTNTL
jgi:hypothetical protein